MTRAEAQAKVDGYRDGYASAAFGTDRHAGANGWPEGIVLSIVEHYNDGFNRGWDDLHAEVATREGPTFPSPNRVIDGFDAWCIANGEPLTDADGNLR